MKNIIKVVLSDIKRMGSNVVAIVIVMGLSIIPALYAWFNIISNWDVYGQDATSQMKIAVYSADTGFTYNSMNINVGDTVVEGLESNSTIGWVFTETEEDAVDGVYAGDYYAALVIPEEFTQNLISFLGGKLENPTISYYENSKKNAIATKITSKAKKAVQEQINTSFIETVAKIVTKTSETLTGAGTEAGSAVDTTLDKLREMDTNLSTYVTVLNTLAMVTDSAGDLVGSGQALIPNMENLVKGSQSTVSAMQGTVISSAQAADSMAMMMDVCFDTLINGLENMNQQLNSISEVNQYVNVSNSLNGLAPMLNSVKELSGKWGVGTQEEMNVLTATFDALITDIGTLQKDSQMTETDLKAFTAQVSKEITTCIQSLRNLKDSFDYTIAPNLKNTVYDVENTLITTSQMLSGIDSNYSDIDRALEDYQLTLTNGTDNISETASYVADIQGKLRNLISGLETLNKNEDYQEIVELFSENPEMIAKFISSPVELTSEAVFPIDSYGSQMAPFYTTLALWVGGLITMALVHVTVEPHEDIPEGLKPYQAYFGRYVTYFLICSAQATITVLGDLFFVQIQCVHPFLFWVSAMGISFTFSLLMYSLTVALGNIGEGLAVILLVIQVAGGGGTFPIEVLPDVYQAIYNYLPFKYAMGAMKECVGGMYRFDYGLNLLALGIVVLISVFIGIVVAIPFRGLLHKIEKSKEKSRVMI